MTKKEREAKTLDLLFLLMDSIKTWAKGPIANPDWHRSLVNLANRYEFVEEWMNEMELKRPRHEDAWPVKKGD